MKPNRNTVEYHLMALSPELRYRALANRATHPLCDRLVSSTFEAITYGFYWQHSPEGSEFWKRISSSLLPHP